VLVAGEEISIPGFGKFSVVTRKARTGLNPQTKKKIKIPAKKAPKFTSAKALKDSVK
jgi:nucleoid DNA-binding protein